MKRAAALILLLACGCRDLHVHVHLPPKQSAAPESPSVNTVLHVEQDGEETAECPSTEAELLQEILK